MRDKHGGMATQDIVAVDGSASVVEEAGAIPVTADADSALTILQARDGASKGEGWSPLS